MQRQYIKYCPTHGQQLESNKFCYMCGYYVNVQVGRPKKPRNFFDPMPIGISDNYVDDNFLKGLIIKSKNTFLILKNSPTPSKHSKSFKEQLNQSIYQNNIPGIALYTDEITLITILFFTLLLYLAFLIYNKKQYSLSRVLNDIFTFLFLVITLFFMTPVIKQWTVNFSDETIVLFVSILMFIHIIFNDYKKYKTKIDLENLSKHVGTPTSLSSVFLAGILLSSRLQISQVFILCFFSLVLFGLSPVLRRQLKHFSRKLFYSMAIFSTFMNFGFLFVYYPVYSLLYISLVIFISFISPLILIWAYQYKNDVQGPWDLPKINQNYYKK